MRKYRCVFHGCKTGAIGLRGFCVVDVEAETPEAARLKVYDTHEHVSDLRMTCVVRAIGFA